MAVSDGALVQVEAADAVRARRAAAAGPWPRGRSAPARAWSAFDWKAGIGTASRVVPGRAPRVGVLVLANFGIGARAARRRRPGRPDRSSPDAERGPAGSCIAVVATDAPLDAAQLERIARRAGLGLARTGSVAHHGSGEIFLAFSTTAGRTRGAAPRRRSNTRLDELFEATVDATEEAVLNALWAAPDVDRPRAAARSGTPARARARASARRRPPRG